MTKTVDDVMRFVAKGYAQSHANCRLLVAEIERLRKELAQEREMVNRALIFRDYDE